ncbi:MAG: hypothetical protein EXS03_00110 [Phycisphaerales bacterium]|nr:hypothetical protein [Phycisphaerales bacterium]
MSEPRHDEEERDEDPSDDDIVRFSRASTRPCQECGQDVSEDSDICPKCRAFQLDEHSGDARARGSATRSLRFAVVIAVIATALALSGLLMVFAR